MFHDRVLEVTKRHPISDQILKVLHAVTFSRAVINSTTLFKSIFTWTSIEAVYYTKTNSTGRNLHSFSISCFFFVSLLLE